MDQDASMFPSLSESQGKIIYVVDDYALKIVGC